jgi:hypothetical protein
MPHYDRGHSHLLGFARSCDYILPAVGLGSYDLSSSYEFITFGLDEAVKLGASVSQHAVDV